MGIQANMPARKRKVRGTGRLSLQEWIDKTGQTEIGKLLKIDRSTAGHWRRGKVLPSSKQMAAISKYTRNAIDWNREITTFYQNGNR